MATSINTEIAELNGTNFDSTIAAGTVLVDFWAPWCGPCRVQGEILHKLAASTPDGVTLAKVNVDEQPALAARYGVRSIPAIFVLRNGDVVESMVGVHAADTLLSTLRKHTAA